MNEAPSNQTGLADTFSSQPSPQSNPFTADLKGEFTSNFGTNTNAVSQIFKEGGFVNQSRTKYLIIGTVVLAVLALVVWFATSGGEEGDPIEGDPDPTVAGDPDDPDADPTASDTSTGESTGTDATASTDTATDSGAGDQAGGEGEGGGDTAGQAGTGGGAAVASVPSGGGGFAMSSGPLSLLEPAEGATINYDETQGPAVFTWSGGSGHLVFSRNQSMNPVSLKVRGKGGQYAFHHPWPGKWYWKMENASGATEVRSFTVVAPARRNISITQPAAGAALAGSGGVVTWQGDGKVAYYRVELTSGSFANPQHRFLSSGNSISLNGVAPGTYQMRLGAFSEVAGRWEYTAAMPVTVQ